MADDERAPEPGHFLPGGEGEQPEPAPTAAPRTALTPPDTVNRQQLGLGKARPIGAPPAPGPRKAAPLPADPEYRGGYSGPPPAPQPGAPVTPLQGTRQIGRARPVGWNTTSTRTGVPEFTSQQPELKQRRRLSRPVVGLISALALIVVSGGAVAAYKLIDSFDSTVANPLTQPTVKPSKTPEPPLPDPTVTKTVEPVPDAVRLQKNELYKFGKLPTVNCPLPKVKPNTKTNVLRFYQALMPCLAETWEPLVVKYYPFRQPKLALAVKGAKGACGGEGIETAYYCPEDETIYMRWEDDAKFYQQNPVAVVDLVRTMAHEYSHHVQMLTNIVISSNSQAGWAKTPAAKLEWSRRLELQASCLGSAFISANQKTLGLVGERLDFWNYLSRHIGDELSDKKVVRDHGSSKSYTYWSGQGFKTANPATCNTYAAPPAKVS